MRVRLLAVTAENALTWRKLEFSLANRGLVLIKGTNGSGKSGIREIISGAVYEKTEKSGWKGDLVNRKIGKDFRVLLEFEREEGVLREEDEDGNKVPTVDMVGYSLSSTRECSGEPTGVQIWRDDEDEPITPIKNANASQKMAADLIGMSFDEFQAVVSLGQEAVHPLIEGTDGSRAEYISKTFDLEYGHYLDVSSRRLKQVLGQLEDLSHTRARRDNLHSRLLPPEGIKRIQSSIRAKKEELELLEEDIERQSADIRKLDRRAEGQKRRARLLKDIPASYKPVAECEAELVEAQKRLSKLQREEKAWSEYRRAKDAHKALTVTMPAERPEYDAEAHKRTVKALGVLEEEHRRSRKLSGSSCPTCGQEVSGQAVDHSQSIRKLMVRLDRMDRAQIERRRYDNKTVELEAMKIPDQPTSNRKEISAGVEEARAAVEKAMAAFKGAARAEAHEAELSSLPTGDGEKTASKARKAQEKLTAARSAANKLRERVVLLRRDVEEQTELAVQVGKMTADLELIDKLEHERRLLTALVAAFGPSGLRRDKVREILDMLAKHLHQYTGALLPRYKFRLIDNEKKTSFVAVDKEDGTEGDVRSLSKGEKKRLSIALLLTERDIRRVKMNVLFLDEFDGGLDHAGIEDLVTILSDLKGEYESIFCISHNPHIHEYEGFDSVVTISRPGAFSKMKEE